MRKITLATLIVICLAAGPAAASTFYPRTIKCPVGGESFTYQAFASYSTFGALPDGQPIGSAAFPLELPQCPKNGLVLYDEFDAATVKRLTPIVEGAAYQALRKTETRYYLAQWLRGQLGETEPTVLWSLLAATWEAKNADDRASIERYSREFVVRVSALPVDPSSIETIALRARAANALRELGRFDEAEALRTTIVIAPDAGGAAENAARNRQGWIDYLALLAPAIARHDASRTPIDLIGEREAVFRCLEPEREPAAARLTGFEAEYCARPDMAKRMAEQRARMAD